MENVPIYTLITVMWLLILAGGGLAVLVLGPVSISGFGGWDDAVTSAFKGAIAVLLVVLWVLILSKVKNAIFRKNAG